MGAFLAPEKLSRWLVTAPSLEEPPEGRVMSAFWAFDISRRHCLDFVFFIPENLYRGRGFLLNFLGL